MIQRLPDAFYAGRELPDLTPADGVKVMSPVFYQGEDVRLDIHLSKAGLPLKAAEHEVVATVKKSRSAANVLWRASRRSGLEEGPAPGFYRFLMPAAVSSRFLPGTYYIDFLAVERSGTESQNLTFVAASGTFHIELSVSSPAPKLAGGHSELVGYDLETGVRTVKITSTEPTLPKGEDITQV